MHTFLPAVALLAGSLSLPALHTAAGDAGAEASAPFSEASASVKSGPMSGCIGPNATLHPPESKVASAPMSLSLRLPETANPPAQTQKSHTHHSHTPHTDTKATSHKVPYSSTLIHLHMKHLGGSLLMVRYDPRGQPLTYAAYALLLAGLLLEWERKDGPWRDALGKLARGSAKALPATAGLRGCRLQHSSVHLLRRQPAAGRPPRLRLTGPGNTPTDRSQAGKAFSDKLDTGQRKKVVLLQASEQSTSLFNLCFTKK